MTITESEKQLLLQIMLVGWQSDPDIKSKYITQYLKYRAGDSKPDKE